MIYITNYYWRICILFVLDPSKSFTYSVIKDISSLIHNMTKIGKKIDPEININYDIYVNNYNKLSLEALIGSINSIKT